MTERNETPVIINADGSVFPFSVVFDITNESEDGLRDAIKDHLEKQGRKLGTYYTESTKGGEHR